MSFHRFLLHFRNGAFWALAAACLATSSWAGTLYTKKSGTPVYAEPSARSSVVETLDGGAPLEQTGQQGKFFQVTTPSGKKGWVFQFKVADEAPAGDPGGGLLGSLGGDKMSARESASASSIRGLSPVAEEHAQKKGISKEDIEAVKAMENFKVPADEVDRFLAQRKLGEYQP